MISAQVTVVCHLTWSESRNSCRAWLYEVSDGVNLQRIGCSMGCTQGVHRVTSPSIKLKYVTHTGPGTRAHVWLANPCPILSPDNLFVQLDIDLQAWPSHLICPDGLCPLYAHGCCTGPCTVTNSAWIKVMAGATCTVCISPFPPVKQMKACPVW